MLPYDDVKLETFHSSAANIKTELFLNHARRAPETRQFMNEKLKLQQTSSLSWAAQLKAKK